MEGLFFLLFFKKWALHSHKIPTFYLIKSQSRLYFYYHYRQWLIRILLYESFGVLVPLFFQVFVIPCVSGGMPVDDSVSLPHGFRGTTRSGDCLHVCPLAALKQTSRRRKRRREKKKAPLCIRHALSGDSLRQDVWQHFLDGNEKKARLETWAPRLNRWLRFILFKYRYVAMWGGGKTSVRNVLSVRHRG